MEVLEKPAVTDITPELYESVFPACAAWVRSMNGSLQDAKDIFHDALIIYMELNGPRHQIQASPKAYILGITKHLWLRKFRKDAALVSLDESEKAIAIPEDYFPSVSTIQLLAFLETFGRNCLDLLQAFYFENLSMKELSARLGYSSEHSATVRKYKCIEKLRDSVKQKLMTYEDFVD